MPNDLSVVSMRLMVFIALSVDMNKGAPISKGPVKWHNTSSIHHFVAEAACETTTMLFASTRTEFSRIPVILVSCVGSILSRTSHPSGSRQWEGFP